MLLRDLVAGIATVQRPVDAAAPPLLSSATLDITAITDDSRHVVPGCLFVARKGTKTDGRAFVAEAIERGAVAVLYDDSDGSGDPCPAQSTVLRVRVNAMKSSAATPPNSGAGGVASGVTRAPPPGACNVSIAACRMAERLEGDPSEWLSLVGLTGTNGKTTTAFLLQQFVRSAANACGVIGTVVIDDGNSAEVATLTTPSGVDISAALGRMVRNGCTACAMEVSSHALDQGRPSALRFRTAIFSNLTGDHLDYHKTMENYADAKARLFAMLPSDGTAVVNSDDPWHERILRDCRAKVLRCTVREDVECQAPLSVNRCQAPLSPVSGESDPPTEMASASASANATEPKPEARPGLTRYGYPGPGPSPDVCTATIHRASLGWQDTTFSGPFGTIRAKLPLVGRHNAMNALQAAAAAFSIGVPAEAIRQALESCTAPPGRLEPVTTPDDPFAVLVDYAHTDDALLNVLTALRPLCAEGGRLTVVFGCGGDRDRTKRPRMMRVACEHADRVIVTSDNPRTEEPDAIIDEILTGRPIEARTVSVQRQADRARAIELAVTEAKAGDIVLIAGKGHEDYQIVGATKRPFDDRVIARSALGRGDADSTRGGTGSSRGGTDATRGGTDTRATSTSPAGAPAQ